MAKIVGNRIQFSDGTFLYDNLPITGDQILEIVQLLPQLVPAIGMAGFPMRGGGAGGFVASGGGGGGFAGQGTPGQAGVSGFSGVSGSSTGTSGFSGLPGVSGFSGISGFSGVSGFSGANPGASGFSGISGFSGVSGTSGISGFSGVSGTSGFSGISGFSGVSGFSGIGSSGFSGFSGISGYSGAATFPPTYVFGSPGTLTTTDNDKILWIPGRNSFVDTATGQVKTAPVGANITIDIQLITRATGAIVSTLGTLTILAGALQGTTPITLTEVLDTQALAAVITGIGSPGTEGANLTIEVF